MFCDSKGMCLKKESQISLPPLESLNFKSLRKDAGLTLRQVEKDTGISNAYLSQVENNKIKDPSYRIVITLLYYYEAKKIKTKHTTVIMPQINKGA